MFIGELIVLRLLLLAAVVLGVPYVVIWEMILPTIRGFKMFPAWRDPDYQRLEAAKRRVLKAHIDDEESKLEVEATVTRTRANLRMEKALDGTVASKVEEAENLEGEAKQLEERAAARRALVAGLGRCFSSDNIANPEEMGNLLGKAADGVLNKLTELPTSVQPLERDENGNLVENNKSRQSGQRRIR